MPILFKKEAICGLMPWLFPNQPKQGSRRKFIDFMTRPEIAVRNAVYVGYSIPNTTAIEMLDEELRNDEVAYPDLDSLDNCEVFEDVSDVIEVYNRIWDQVKAAH